MGCPKWLWGLHPWRYSKHGEHGPEGPTLADPTLGRGAGPGRLQGTTKTQPFCDSVVYNCVEIKTWYKRYKGAMHSMRSGAGST